MRRAIAVGDIEHSALGAGETFRLFRSASAKWMPRSTPAAETEQFACWRSDG